MLQAADFTNNNASAVHGMGLLKQSSISPETYLGFAQQDLAGEMSPRALVNALSNCKRALHFQVELMTDALGIQLSAQSKRPPFPARISFAERCGIVSPPILRKLNALRNEVEHEYVLPERDRVEDLYDVTTLFLEATAPQVRGFPVLREVYRGTGSSVEHYCLLCIPSSGTIHVYAGELLGLMKRVPHPIPSGNLAALRPNGVKPVLTVSATRLEEFVPWAMVLLGRAK